MRQDHCICEGILLVFARMRFSNIILHSQKLAYAFSSSSMINLVNLQSLHSWLVWTRSLEMNRAFAECSDKYTKECCDLLQNQNRSRCAVCKRRNFCWTCLSMLQLCYLNDTRWYNYVTKKATKERLRKSWYHPGACVLYFPHSTSRLQNSFWALCRLTCMGQYIAVFALYKQRLLCTNRITQEEGKTQLPLRIRSCFNLECSRKSDI
jgi:hypothetical protein